MTYDRHGRRVFAAHDSASFENETRIGLTASGGRIDPITPHADPIARAVSFVLKDADNTSTVDPSNDAMNKKEEGGKQEGAEEGEAGAFEKYTRYVRYVEQGMRRPPVRRPSIGRRPDSR